MNRADYEVRFLFDSESARDEFMVTAIRKHINIDYALDNGDSIIISKATAKKLNALAKRFGAISKSPERTVDEGLEKIFDYDERVKAWNNFAAKIDAMKID